MASYDKNSTPTKEQIIKMREDAAESRYIVKIDDYSEFDSGKQFLIWDDNRDLLHVIGIHGGVNNDTFMATSIVAPIVFTTIDYAQIRMIYKFYE